jgi:hypothetical protein
MFKKSLCVLVGVLPVLLAAPVKADTISAANCSSSAVQTAINSASSGDTILVPAGNCTWTSGVDVPNGKNLVLQGAGSSNTVITMSLAGTAVALNVTASRLTGFGFILPSGSASNDVGRITARGQGWRIDHNTFTNNVGGNRRCVYNSGGTGIPHPVGLIDHNTFTRCRVDLNGDLSEAAGNNIWFQPTGLGTNNAVFIEDNTFAYDASHMGNMADSEFGGRYVVRFNTIIGSPTEAHGFGGGRATRSWEIYNNIMINCSGCSSHFNTFLRGGTGMVFNNSMQTGYGDIAFDLDRDTSGGAGFCDGSKNYDGNIRAGWPCRDQVGRGSDAFLSPTYFGAPSYPSQASEPVGIWRNRNCSTPPCAITDQQSPLNILNNDSAYIADCADLQNERAIFNGTCGTGVGLAASRPSTCTVGVYYWATNEGEWNSLNGAVDGRLYKCVSTNTWTLYYTPYTYPHPLQGSGGGGSQQSGPTAPANLRILSSQ